MVLVRSVRLTALLVSATVATAHAQTAPDGRPLSVSAAAGSDPAGASSVDPNGEPGGFMPKAPGAPPLATDPYPGWSPAPPAPLSPQLAPLISSVGPPLAPLVHQRFRAGRVVYNVGTAVSFVGSSLTLASVVVSAVYGLGLDPSSDQLTGRIGPGLAYGGSSATGAGFIMVSTGLGLQHSALALAGQDPGRGMYAAGNVLGVLGLCGIGTSYFFGATKVGGDNAPLYSFSAAIAAGTLLTVSSLLFFSDAIDLRRVYRRLTTF